MKTGELARSAGVNLRAIRFYEKQGLVSEHRCWIPLLCPERPRARNVHQANEELGFTLAEIKQLLDLHAVLAEMRPKSFRKRPGELHQSR